MTNGLKSDAVAKAASSSPGFKYENYCLPAIYVHLLFQVVAVWFTPNYKHTRFLMNCVAKFILLHWLLPTSLPATCFCGPHSNKDFYSVSHSHCAQHIPIYACTHAHTKHTWSPPNCIWYLTRLKHRYELASVIYMFIFRALEMN